MTNAEELQRFLNQYKTERYLIVGLDLREDREQVVVRSWIQTDVEQHNFVPLAQLLRDIADILDNQQTEQQQQVGHA